MELEAIVNLIKDTGVTIGILIYFCWRDCKYMQKIDTTMDVIKAFLAKENKEN